jgi:hypothetical protein
MPGAFDDSPGIGAIVFCASRARRRRRPKNWLQCDGALPNRRPSEVAKRFRRDYRSPGDAADSFRLPSLTWLRVLDSSIPGMWHMISRSTA